MSDTTGAVVSREWDARSYDELARSHRRWAVEVAGRLRLGGDELVVDAGAGTGRLTEVVLDRLPQGRVLAVDGSRQMLAQLTERLPDPRIETHHADLLDPLPVSHADAVVSSATFHWIHDHERLFANLAAALRSGGQLVAQCGGEGNIASIVDAVERVHGTAPRSWHYATVDETVARLAAARFDGVEVWSEDDPLRLDAGEPLRRYLRTIVLGGELEGLPDAEHEDYVAAVAEVMPDSVIDYVRLNIVARRR